MPKSFDLYDTLVCGRNTKVAAGNQKTQFPVAENIAKLEPGDLIVSDYEHPERAKKLLKSLGITNELFVTGDGKYTGKVWATLPAKPQSHLGDNQRADVDSPNEAGIVGILSSVHKLTEAEQYLVDQGLPQLAHVCRETRLSTWSTAYRGIQLLQADYNFPVLFLASIVLNRMFPTQTLLMSGRDCFMWQKLMDRLYGRGVYWQTSVIARLNADDNYYRYIESFRQNKKCDDPMCGCNYVNGQCPKYSPVLVDISGSGNSFSKLPYPSVLMYKPTHGVPHIPCMVTSDNCWRIEQANCAPHEKCSGVDANLKPIFINKSRTDFANHPETNAQVAAFTTAIDVMKNYDQKRELQTDSETCKRVMSHLLHQYINFAEAVEPLRRLAIADDAE